MGHIRYEVERAGRDHHDRPAREAQRHDLRRCSASSSGRSGAAGDDDDARVVIITGRRRGVLRRHRPRRPPRHARGASAARGGRRDDPRSGQPWPIVACPKPVIARRRRGRRRHGRRVRQPVRRPHRRDRARFGWVFVHRGLVPDTGAGTLAAAAPRRPDRTPCACCSPASSSTPTRRRLGYVSSVVAPDELARGRPRRGRALPQPARPSPSPAPSASCTRRWTAASTATSPATRHGPAGVLPVRGPRRGRGLPRGARPASPAADRPRSPVDRSSHQRHPPEEQGPRSPRHGGATSCGSETYEPV